jgi:peptidoglycan/xylan/chitin deacetylase (PgdA/CDA1 family)
VKVRRILWITLLLGLALVGAMLLPLPQGFFVALGLIGLYLGVCFWGTISLRSGIFVSAITRVPGETSRVALTYDDGPDPRSTPLLLDLLRARGVVATFFVVGKRVREYPEIVRRCVAEGHLIANHSDLHSGYTNCYHTRRTEKQLRACQEAVEEAAGVRPEYYRPPFGLANDALDGATRRLGLRVVGWQARSLDTTWLTVDQVVRRSLRRIRPGGILLLHDGGLEPERVVSITERILDGLEERRLVPVRLDVLLGSAAEESAAEDPGPAAS